MDAAGSPDVSPEDIGALHEASDGDETSDAGEDSASEGDFSVSARPFDPPALDIPRNLSIDPKRVTMLSDVKLRVKIQLGRTRMLVEDVLRLGEGSVVELDKLADEPVDVLVNDRLVARGEVLVLNDNFCVRISEVVSHDPHRITT